MREKQKKIIQWSSLALILLTGIIVWRVNYEIDFMMDDEWYSTLLYADTPIRNLGDIVHAQIWHYFNWGGRSMAHALLQMILLTGESWADILKTKIRCVLKTTIFGFGCTLPVTAALTRKKYCITCEMTAMHSRVERFKAGSTRVRSF